MKKKQHLIENKKMQFAFIIFIPRNTSLKLPMIENPLTAKKLHLKLCLRIHSKAILVSDLRF